MSTFVQATFNEYVAQFFNNYIESEKLRFGSYENKAAWAREQIANETPLGYAAVRFAMKQCGLMWFFISVSAGI